MTDLCQDIDLFADGALDEARAEAFRQHLPGCQRCQAELADRVQLRLLADEYGRHGGGTRTRARSRVSRRVAAGAAAIAAALVVAVLVRGMFGQPPADPWLTHIPQRPLDARLAYAGIDEYRARASAKMMGPSVEARVLPLQELVRLEDRGDLHGLLAAYLVREDWKNAREVLGQIQARTTEEKDALVNDEAVLRLGDGEPEEALRLLDGLLQRRPDHLQARWNRALTLQALRLDLTAAQAFEEIATRGEPGWAAEAGERARALREPMEKHRTRWLRTQEAAQRWIRGDPLPPEVLAEPLPILRLHFYDAVRVAKSREHVQALLPVAQALDPRGVLERYVRDVASHDFGPRAPLAEEYARLLEGKLSSSEQQDFIEALRHAQEHDLLLGALVQTGKLSTHLDELEQRASALQDPWFQVIALQEQAKALAGSDRLDAASQKIEEARRLCQEAGIIYRCLALEFEMTNLFISHNDLDRARTHAEVGLGLAETAGEWEKERQFIQNLANIARFQDESALANACGDEAFARAQGDPRYEKAVDRDIHQGKAHMHLRDLRFQDARRELDEITRSDTPLTLVGALVLADLARKLPASGDEANLRRALDSLGDDSLKSQQALVTHTRGRFFIESDPERGRRLLRDAIREAELAGKNDPVAQRARMHSFTLLILDAGKRGDYEESIRLFSEEQEWALPTRCLVAATVETERSLIVVRGAFGEVRGFFEGDRQERLRKDLSGLVPPDAIDLVRPCDRVDVFARPPLLGRDRLLPPDLPWAYRIREAPRHPEAARPDVHLVVADVELPTHDALVRRRRLQPLRDWAVGEPKGEVMVKLLGREATPARVLKEMSRATAVDIATHGMVSRGGKPYLVLAEDGNGEFELKAERILELTLAGAPLVILAACEAGDAAPGVHETHSLPEAFVRAGARGVIAATTEIPYEDAKRFFPALRARIQNGEPPVTALWRERAAWLQRNQGTDWLPDVYLVE